MKKQLIIIGTGLFPEVARCYFEEFGGYKVLGFACHQAYRQTDTIYGLPLHTIEMLVHEHPPGEVDVFVALGYKNMNKVRQRVYEEMKSLEYNCVSFVYPGVRIWDSTKLGDNVFIFEDNTIQPFTTIGNNTVLWSGNHVGHHSSIGDHCFISSHVVISGSCKVGNNVFIGVNAILHDSINVEEECLIGAGAIVSKHTKPKEVYVPASTKVFPKSSDQVVF